MTPRGTWLGATLILTLGCSSIDGNGFGGTGGIGSAGVSGNGGTGGGGGTAQIPSDQAKTPEECEWLGGGGADAVSCDYVTVHFSTALGTTGLSVEATTSAGDTLTPVDDFDPREPPDDPVLVLSLDDAETHATGFTIKRFTKQPHYAPSEVAVVIEVDQAVVADATLEPEYACVELTGDDWCWQAEPLTLTLSP